MKKVAVVIFAVLTALSTVAARSSSACSACQPIIERLRRCVGPKYTDDTLVDCLRKPSVIAGWDSCYECKPQLHSTSEIQAYCEKDVRCRACRPIARAIMNCTGAKTKEEFHNVSPETMGKCVCTAEVIAGWHSCHGCRPGLPSTSELQARCEAPPPNDPCTDCESIMQGVAKCVGVEPEQLDDVPRETQLKCLCVPEVIADMDSCHECSSKLPSTSGLQATCRVYVVLAEALAKKEDQQTMSMERVQRVVLDTAAQTKKKDQQTMSMERVQRVVLDTLYPSPLL